ncbi:MAG: hypothetical protein ABFD23_02680 [Caldisericales bacterium]|jgi:hypothetical protein|nr:hypothetical protein [bacterium]NMD14981.1 hypothetical protein [Caldisericales bacterium]
MPTTSAVNNEQTSQSCSSPNFCLDLVATDIGANLAASSINASLEWTESSQIENACLGWPERKKSILRPEILPQSASLISETWGTLMDFLEVSIVQSSNASNNLLLGSMVVIGKTIQNEAIAMAILGIGWRMFSGNQKSVTGRTSDSAHDNHVGSPALALVTFKRRPSRR